MIGTSNSGVAILDDYVLVEDESDVFSLVERSSDLAAFPREAGHALAVCDRSGTPLAAAVLRLECAELYVERSFFDGVDAEGPLSDLLDYCALRRARILGVSHVACIGRERATGMDLWLDRRIQDAYGRWFAKTKRALDSNLFSEELRETVDGWVVDLSHRGFFHAVLHGTITQNQLIFTLANMHQFVRWTTRLLGMAVSMADDRALRDHLLEHLDGEINHELIIERDLTRLGADVEYVTRRMPPAPATRLFMAQQESTLSFHRDPLLFLTSPLAAEGIAARQPLEFLEGLRRALVSWGVPNPVRAVSFFESHLKTDGGEQGHWEETLATIAGRMRSEEERARCVAALRASMLALTMAYDEYVSEVA